MLEAKNLDREISIKKIDHETLNIKILNNNILIEIVGEFNKNLIKLEKLTNTKIFFRGNSMTVKGDKDKIFTVSNSLTFLVNKFLVTGSIEDNDINYSIKKVGNFITAAKFIDSKTIPSSIPPLPITETLTDFSFLYFLE